MRFRNAEQQRRWMLKRYTPVTETGCWLWLGATTGKGYGQITPSRHHPFQLAHRYFYEQLVGPIPEGLILCHKCDTPLCVNPQHMHVGTQQDNVRQMRDRNRGAYGATNAPKKLTDEAVREILLSDESKNVLGPRYGVSGGTISAIRGGRVWRHVHAQLDAEGKEVVMARRFGYPDVANLAEAGSSAYVPITNEKPSYAAYKVRRWAARNGRAFTVETYQEAIRVTRLPDPEPRAE